jgi:hypothetical protein
MSYDRALVTLSQSPSLPTTTALLILAILLPKCTRPRSQPVHLYRSVNSLLITLLEFIFVKVVYYMSHIPHQFSRGRHVCIGMLVRYLHSKFHVPKWFTTHRHQTRSKRKYTHFRHSILQSTETLPKQKLPIFPRVIRNFETVKYP